MFAEIWLGKSTESYAHNVKQLEIVLGNADAVVIGAGSGLSAAAGFTYEGERFQKHFADFIEKYHISDLYSGGFYPYESLEEYWAWWSRHIYYNRYVDIPKPIYQDLYELVKDKDYFVLTTNVDHCFQKAGFHKEKLFYTQGDYGLFQCPQPCHPKTYDNEYIIRKMLEQQEEMRIPSELIPYCPVCGRPMTVNLRCDNSFVEDEGWQKASERYLEFVRMHEGLRVLFLELGVGTNTPGIIKYPFRQMTAKNPNAVYACVNYEKAAVPYEILKQSICIEGDLAAVINEIHTSFCTNR